MGLMDRYSVCQPSLWSSKCWPVRASATWMRRYPNMHTKLARVGPFLQKVKTASGAIAVRIAVR